MQVLMTKPSHTGQSLDEELGPDYPFLVNWTGAIAEHPDFLVLNEKSRTNKLSQLIQLDLKGVSIPKYSLIPRDGWLPRSIMHQQGRDFTHPPAMPEFWVERILAEDEWRLHFFRTSKGNLRLLRSGIKLPKKKPFHPWVRSHRLGWKISYTGGAPLQVVEEGRKAMDALDLDFGAVDILFQPTPYISREGNVWVLEVNTCPGLDSGTLQMYINNFWERGEVA